MRDLACWKTVTVEQPVCLTEVTVPQGRPRRMPAHNMKKFVIVRDSGLMNSPFVALAERSGAEGRP